MRVRLHLDGKNIIKSLRQGQSCKGAQKQDPVQNDFGTIKLVQKQPTNRFYIRLVVPVVQDTQELVQCSFYFLCAKHHAARPSTSPVEDMPVLPTHRGPAKNAPPPSSRVWSKYLLLPFSFGLCKILEENKQPTACYFSCSQPQSLSSTNLS